MNWMISDISNYKLILCGIFYSVLCVFSIVTGIIYAKGNRELNPIELSDKFVKKLNTEKKLKEFSKKMGIVTIIVGIIQGITAIAIFKGHSIVLYIIAMGFTIFSIASVSLKLISSINKFSLTKLAFYIIIFMILLLQSSRALFF